MGKRKSNSTMYILNPGKDVWISSTNAGKNAEIGCSAPSHRYCCKKPLCHRLRHVFWALLAGLYFLDSPCEAKCKKTAADRCTSFLKARA